MIRLVLRRHAGTATANLTVARRLARKIRGAQRSGHCVLIDCDEMEPSQEFLDELLKEARPERVKFCGLPIMRQITMALRFEEKGRK